MNYESHIHTNNIEETVKVLLEIYQTIGSTTLDNIDGEHDIDISIVSTPKAK